MYIAQAKRRENIAEYILYLWQLEDLLRALRFRPEAIYSYLVEPTGEQDPKKQLELMQWYTDMVSLLNEEGKLEKGHLEHTQHLIGDLQSLHDRLMTARVGNRYRELFAYLQPELAGLRVLMGDEDISDVELLFRALYAVMLYRMKGDEKRESSISDVIELISPVVGELARIFHLAELGELDIWEE